MGLECFLQINPSLELQTWDKQGVDLLCAKWHRISFKGDYGLLIKVITSHLSFTSYPLFFHPLFLLTVVYPQSKEILSNLSMKFWYSAFNAQGLSVIIVVVQVGAVKIYM
jgi:hypothetical protein